jgi:hypothetical protein
LPLRGAKGCARDLRGTGPVRKRTPTISACRPLRPFQARARERHAHDPDADQ